MDLGIEHRRPNRSVAIGIEAEANFDDSIALGNKVRTTQEGQVVIGNETSHVVINSIYEDPVTGVRTNFEKGIIISGVDIIKELSELRELCKMQQEMIDALWDAPGMPGYNRLLAELEDLRRNT